MSIEMQTKLQAAEIAIEQLQGNVRDLKQTVDALVSVVERRNTEADEDRELIKKLMEHVGSQTMKGSVHGKGLRVRPKLDRGQAKQAS